jgi:hypothetical protein
MAAIAADRHLPLGLLALQNGLINQSQLVAAFQAWTLEKSRPLADHLVALGHLSPAQRSVVEAMAARLSSASPPWRARWAAARSSSRGRCVASR